MRIPLAALALVPSLAASISHAAGVNWPQPGNNAAHTADNTAETTLSASNVASLAQRWSFTTGAQIDAPPVLQGKTVFALSTDGNLYALNAATGKLLWSYQVNINGAPGNWGVVANAKMVFVNCQLDYDGSEYGGHGGLCGLDAATGKLVWSWAIYDEGVGNPVDSSPYGPPVLANNTLYIGEADSGSFYHVGYMIALNSTTGIPQWGVGNCGDTGFNDCNYVSGAPPAAIKGSVFYNAGDQSGPPGNAGAVCRWALDASAPAWCAYTTDSGLAPSLSGGKVLFEQAQNTGTQIVALNESTGAAEWTTNVTATGSSHFAPAVADDKAYFNIGGSLYAVSAKNGKVAWLYTAGGAAGGIASGLSVANGVVYAECTSGAGQLCAFNATTGALLASIGIGGARGAGVIVANGAVFSVCGYNSLCRYAP